MSISINKMRIDAGKKYVKDFEKGKNGVLVIVLNDEKEIITIFDDKTHMLMYLSIDGLKEERYEKDCEWDVKLNTTENDLKIYYKESTYPECLEGDLSNW